MNVRELEVLSGAIIAYRLFDVAYSINLPMAESLWRERARSSSTRARLSTADPKAVAFGVAPVEVTLEQISLQLGAVTATVGVTVRLYDFGVVTIALRLPASGLTWQAFVEFMDRIDRRLGTGAETQGWAELLSQICTTFADALVRPSPSTIEEDYLIGAVEAFSETLSAEDLQRRVDLVPLLSGERRPLSAAARQELLRESFSYYTDDLVVLTWDRAFIYEPRRDSDVADVLEVANAQLLEMRYYDELLDAELPRMYDLIDRTRRRWALPGARRFADLARRLYTVVAEVTELTEKVDNALQVTEDVYLARIYAAALDLFRVPTVSAAVDRKLSIIRDTYTALYDEAHSSRSEWLEIVILVLIFVEIVLAVVR